MTIPRTRSPEPDNIPISRDSELQAPASDHDGITVIDIVSVLLRHRMMIVLVAFLAVLGTVRHVMQLPRYYSTDAEFMPEGSHGQSQILGLAQQFGIGIGADGADTPQFYMDLIDSRSILAEVAKTEYEMKTDSGTFRGNLTKLFGASKLKPSQQGPFVVAQLKSQIDVGASAKTGVMTLTVRALTSDLAVQIANSILVQVNLFNLERRQHKAGAERAFVEKRQADALAELHDSEANLESFLMQNRDFTRSPALQIAFGRLNRTVEMRQTIYTSLAASYEQAKIEEVRDLPVITVLAPPEAPLAPESRHGTRKAILALFGGLALGALIAFALAGLAASTRVHPNDVAEFDRLKKEAVDDLKHPWLPVKRLFSRGKQRSAA